MQTEKPWGQMIFGLAAILVSGLIILGSLSFTLLEGKPEIALLPATTNISLETALKITIVPGEPTFTPILLRQLLRSHLQ